MGKPLWNILYLLTLHCLFLHVKLAEWTRLLCSKGSSFLVSSLAVSITCCICRLWKLILSNKFSCLFTNASASKISSSSFFLFFAFESVWSKLPKMFRELERPLRAGELGILPGLISSSELYRSDLSSHLGKGSEVSRFKARLVDFKDGDTESLFETDESPAKIDCSWDS